MIDKRKNSEMRVDGRCPSLGTRMRGTSSSTPTKQNCAAWVEHRATKMRASWGEGSQQIRTKVDKGGGGQKEQIFADVSYMDAPSFILTWFSRLLKL